MLDIIRKQPGISPESLVEIEAVTTNQAYVDISKTPVSEEAMRDVSRKAAATYRFIPFDVKEGKLLVAMENPDDFQALEAIQFIAKRRGVNPDKLLASGQRVEKTL